MQSLSHHQARYHVEFLMIPVEKAAKRNPLGPLTGSRYGRSRHVDDEFRGAGQRESGMVPMTSRENYDGAGFGQCDGHLWQHGVTIVVKIDGAS